MTKVTRAARLFQRKGVLSGLAEIGEFVYNTYVWPRLPETGDYRSLSRVRTPPKKRWFDTVVPWQTPGSDQEVEDPLYNEMISKYVEEGDSVVIIGGAWGVSTVKAARIVGEGGEVLTFEGAETMYGRTKRTIELNGVGERVKVHNAIVSDNIRLMGSHESSVDILPADQLPEGDVLLVDCDGCELELLAQLDSFPDRVIIEHHAVDGDEKTIDYQPEAVRRALRDIGYDVVEDETGAIIGSPHFGTEEAVFVGIRDSNKGV